MLKNFQHYKMMQLGFISCLLYIVPTMSAKPSELPTPCDEAFSSRCLCGNMKYLDKVQYVVNCTNTQFQNASVLQNLPSKTQVLIFTGNNINELPTNVFGTENTYLDLKVVDMSNNNIQDIRGKSYHRVTNVERLILNHNQISISSKEPNHHHPRVFSNFVNLLELHLTDAFADNTPEDLASDLHDIFINSDLQQLRKLHLEQNKISKFKDSQVFCDLPNLQDLHLGQNKLTGIHFELDCMPKLRFLDLEFNNIQNLGKEDLRLLDKYSSSYNHSLTIDLSNNTLSGDCDGLYSWVQVTKVTIRNKERLHCRTRPLSANQCPVVLNAPVTAVQSSHTGTELFLFVALCLTLALLAYTNWRPIETHMKPLANALSRKVHYTNLGKQDDQEINV